MGRKKLNRPESELIEERKARQLRYYNRNKDRLNAKRLENYYRSKTTKEDEQEGVEIRQQKQDTTIKRNI